MKRIVSLLLVAFLLVGLFPAAWAADSGAESRSLDAMEVSGLSRLDEKQTAEARQEAPGYQPEDLVTVIVTMKQEPVLAGFDRDAVSG